MRVSTILKTLQFTSATLFFIVVFTLYYTAKTAANAAPASSSSASSSQSAVSSDWQYSAPKGSSLTILVRRSLMLYDQQNKDINLSKAQIIFAETNIVKQIGPRLLKIGERVKIASSLVGDYATKSTNLSQKQLTAWQVYVNRASFQLDYLQPESTPGVSTQPGQTQSTNTEQTPQSKLNSNSTTSNQNPAKTAEHGKTSGWWWLIGISALVILYYLARTPTATEPK